MSSHPHFSFQNGNLRVKKQGGIAANRSSFVVKIQVPPKVGPGICYEKNPMLIYNEDRSVLGEISEFDPAYGVLEPIIKKNGICQFKAYFRIMKTSKGYKVNPNRMVEMQPW